MTHNDVGRGPSRSRMSRLWSFTSASTALLVLAFVGLASWLGVSQWRWAKEIGWAEEARQNSTVRRSAWLLKRAVDREFKLLGEHFKIDSSTQATNASLESTLRQRSRNWRQDSLWPDLLGGIYKLEFDSSGASDGAKQLRWYRLDQNEKAGWALLDPPEGLPPEDELAESRPTILSGEILTSEPPRLAIPVAGESLNGSRQVVVVLELDQRVFTDSFLPQLQEWFLPPREFGEVRTLLVDTDSNRLIHSSHDARSRKEFGEVHAFVELLPRGAVESPEETIARFRPCCSERDERSIEWESGLWNDLYPPGQWTLLVQTRDRPLPKGIAGLRTQEVVFAFFALSLLSVTFLAAIASVRKTRKFARERLQVIARLSHELRTPIAILAAAGENLTDELVTDDTQRRQYGDIIRREAERLRTLTESTLRLAHSDSPNSMAGDEDRKLNLETRDLVSFVRGILQDFEPQAARAGFKLDTDLEPEKIPMRFDADAVRSALLNLLNNAVKYGDRAKWLRVQVSRDVAARAAIVQVENGGPEIPAEELGRVTEAYFRGDRAHVEQIEGIGLGLAVVKDVMRAHGGQVSLASSAESTVATLRFPLSPIGTA